MILQIASNLQINIDKILETQEKFKGELESLEKKLSLDKDYSYESDLKDIINTETKKYDTMLSRDLKIKKNKDKKAYLEKLNNDIYEFIETSISKENIYIEIFIKTTNKLIYPKGIWGETMSPSGQRYYKHYESGVYRNTQEFISVGGTSYYFINPEEIEQAIKALNIFLENKDISPIIKYVFYIFYFWNIHPFNDGNGAIARFLFPSLYLANGFKAVAFEYKNFFIDHSTKLFYDKNNINYDDIVSDFIEYMKNM